MDFKLEVRDAGGHSSEPKPTNAIYKLAAALSRIGELQFPMALNETTRPWFERAATFEEAAVAGDMRAVARPNPGRRQMTSRPSMNCITIHFV